MRQILYRSTSTVPGDGADLTGILRQSRHNNAIDGITGLLWSDGTHFLQVFEGDAAGVAQTWGRIQADARHHDIAVLLDGPIDAAQFSDWAMAHCRKGESAGAYDRQMRRLLANASPAVSEAFLAMMRQEGS